MRARISIHQQGQAMIEALIACALVMVPLFLAIPTIAKYLDIRSYTVQAARYAAWERTVWFGGDAAAPMGITTSAADCASGSSSFCNKWDANEKTDDQIRLEIGKRLLSETGPAAFTSAASTSTVASAAFTSAAISGTSYPGGPKMLWRDRHGTTLLQDYGDTSVSVGNAKAPGLINDLLSPLMAVTSVFSNFTVDTKAQYTSNISIKVQQVAYNTDAGLGGCAGCAVDYIVSGTPMFFAEKQVLVANGWSANGPGSYDEFNTTEGRDKMTTYNQVRGLTPSSVLKPSSGIFKTVLDILDAIALVFFPELSTLDLGRIEVDRVPADRLR